MRQNRNDTKQKSPNNPRPESYTEVNKNGESTIRKDLLDSEAINEAKNFKEKQVSYTQLRRFFGAAKEALIKINDSDDNNQAKLEMAMLKAKAYYAAGRLDKNKPLAEFFEHHSILVKTVNDYKHFMQHFEAVIAYHRYYYED